MAIFKVN